MSAIVPKNGPTRQLDAPAEPDAHVTEEEVEDAPRLVRRLMGALRDIATLKRRWWPRTTDFEDRTVDATGATKYRFPHGFGTSVRWWAVDWEPTAVGTELRLSKHADTDSNTLVLVSGAAGVVTVRVEEVG